MNTESTTPTSGLAAGGEHGGTPSGRPAAGSDPLTAPGGPLGRWLEAVARELDVDLAVDMPLLLDLAGDAAHAVARPAAPLTTFLVGYAAALRGGGAADVAEVARRVSELAGSWSPGDDVSRRRDGGRGAGA